MTERGNQLIIVTLNTALYRHIERPSVIDIWGNIEHLIKFARLCYLNFHWLYGMFSNNRCL